MDDSSSQPPDTNTITDGSRDEKRETTTTDVAVADGNNNTANANDDANGVAISLSAQEQDAKTRAQMDAIGEEIRANQKLTSSLLPISELSREFVGSGGDDGNNNNNNNGFLKGCSYLSTVYESYRAVRGDGNCYYRAFLFALVESLACCSSGNNNSECEFQRIRDYVHRSIEDVVRAGYDETTISMFHDEMVDLLAAVAKENEQKQTLTTISSSLCDTLNEENGASDYCVWYLRVITSSYLKSDPGRFVHFLDDPSYTDVATYCSKEIDPMGRECTMVGVLALAEAFRIKVEIEYLDGNSNGNNNKLVKHSFGAENDDNDSISPLCITLLYRPGHYDILYK